MLETIILSCIVTVCHVGAPCYDLKFEANERIVRQIIRETTKANQKIGAKVVHKCTRKK